MRTILLLTILASWSVAAESRPNVVLMLSDDQGWGDLGFTGNKQIDTPNLDRLCGEGRFFRRFHVSPVCAPTRAALLTGRYAHRSGVTGVARGDEIMDLGGTALPQALKAAGWRTGLFGKWHNGAYAPHDPLGRGFDHYLGFSVGHLTNYFDTELVQDRSVVQTTGFVDEVLTTAALSFIDAQPAQPFFCMVTYNLPHSPFQVPDAEYMPYQAKGLEPRLAAIHGMVTNLDRQIGRVLTHLREKNLERDTIVVFLSDNGPNGPRWNDGLRGTKGSAYEGGVRVPFVLRYPARFPQAGEVHTLAMHIDLMPTLLELCRVTTDGLKFDGRSLVPLLTDPAAAWQPRTLFTRVGGHDKPFPAAACDGRYRLVAAKADAWELFDLEQDPGEQRNIASEQPQVAARLRTQYDAWWQDVSHDLRRSPPPIQIGLTNDAVRLEAQDAQPSGLRYSSKHPNNAWLTGWTTTEATVGWQVQVAKPGMYACGVAYACPSSDAGAAIVLGGGKQSLHAMVTAAPPFDLPSPDRFPRDEATERHWAVLDLGTTDLPAGPVTLTLRATTKPGMQVMDVMRLIVRPLGK